MKLSEHKRSYSVREIFLKANGLSACKANVRVIINECSMLSQPDVRELHASKRAKITDIFLPLMVPEVIFLDCTIQMPENCQTQLIVQL